MAPGPAVFAADCRIPHPSLTTFNFRSLSVQATKRRSVQSHRHGYVMRCIKRYLAISNILCAQETWLKPNDAASLQASLPNHKVFYNNHPVNRAGTLVIVDNRLLRHYKVREIPPRPGCEGRVQVLHFSDALASETQAAKRDPFYLINLYLQSGDESVRRSEQLSSLLRLPVTPDTRSFLVGDLNFVESPQDDASGDHCVIPAAWPEVVEHFSLREVSQPLHTCFSLSTSTARCRSSRLDRIYISHTDTDNAILAPQTHVPYVKGNILECSRRASSGARTYNPRYKPSDHLPVALFFTPSNPPSNKRRTRCSPHLAEEAHVLDFIRSHWQGWRRHTSQSCYAALDAWKSSVASGCTHHFKMVAKRKREFTTRAASLSASLRLLRIGLSPRPDPHAIQRVLHTTPSLSIMVDGQGEVRLRPLELQVQALLNAGAIGDKDPNAIDLSDSLSPPPLPPSSSPARPSAHISMLDDIRGSLPSTRARLHALKPDSNSNPTSDPKTMAQIILRFWRTIWAARTDAPSGKELDDYLRDYLPTAIPGSLIPSIPDLDTIIDGLLGSSNSAPGPDGIPFAFYRAFAHELGPIFQAIVNDLAAGNLPPAGYNYACLFLIPKNNSMEIPDTRPISVTNADNRIVASLIARAISPALEAILLQEQKGFIPGRLGSDHIHNLTHRYYSSLSQKAQYYILFLDTAKAFDSLDHSFIIKTLHKIGLPAWVARLVQGLLHDVRVFPVLSEDTGVFIRIQRGVKQGCPLSPLLFAICYDPLLHQLRGKPLATNCAFADDLAVGSPRLKDVTDSLHLVLAFAKFSGLGINIKKTVILTSQSPTRQDNVDLGTLGLKIKFVDRATYLGVLVGRDISTIDIFKPALVKFEGRLKLYRPTLSRLSLHKRILIFNIYLLPLFYYLAQFYIIPYYEVVVPVREATHRATVAFNGGGFAYAHLISTTDNFGPRSPLRDLWATNMALLAAQFDSFTFSEGHPTPQMGPYSHVYHYRWGSLLIDEHVAYAAFKYMEDSNPRDTNRMLSLSHLSGNRKQRRAKLYTHLVLEEYWYPRESTLSKYPTSLPNKLARLGVVDPVASANVKTHAIRSSRRFPPHVWNTNLRLIFNALPTDLRRFQAQMRPTPRGPDPHSNPFPCYLCGVGTDSIRHLHGGGCPIVEAALDIVSQATHVPLHYTLNNLLLNFNAHKHPKRSDIIISFNFAVWHQRTDFFITLAGPPKASTAVNRLVECCLDTLPKGSVRSISSSAAIGEIVLSPPPDSLAIFTDGSALGNPGPTGAGLYVIGPLLNGHRFTLTISVGLGAGTNNLGEAFGIDLALSLLHVLRRASSTIGRAFIASDSMLCIGYLCHRWSFSDQAGVPSIRHARTSLRSFISPPRMYWVRGHAKVHGNEMADAGAKRGAGFSLSSPSLTVPAYRAVADISPDCPDWVRTCLSQLNIQILSPTP
jgi:ribonuclease HI